MSRSAPTVAPTLHLRLHREIRSVGRPLALAIGNFDGVHLGHQAILADARKAASRLGFSAAALSFSPLPREYFCARGVSPGETPARLMSVSEKLTEFVRAGITEVFIARFNAGFAAQSPHEFFDALLHADVRWLCVGEDFRFGAKRAGDVRLLQALGARHGLEVVTHAEVTQGGDRVSSTAIRQLLTAGRLTEAAAMMGREYRIVGRVTHGKKLGRSLGFPTANIALTGRKPALHGVFAVKCRLVTRGLEGVAELGKADVGPSFDGVANLGTNPVVSSENRQHLEVFLFDFSGDLYGKRIEVSFIEKIRDELNLPSLDALVTQMHDDAAQARTILSRKNDGRAKERLQNHP